MTQTTQAVEHLKSLIDQYWALAYREGTEGRTRDTEDGAAQATLHEINTTIAALANQQEAAAPVGDQYLCHAWGESDRPVAAIVTGLEAVRKFLITQWLGDENDRDWSGELTLPRVMAELEGRDWLGEGAWTAEFEIGGISVNQVDDVGEPAASRVPVASLAEPSKEWLYQMQDRHDILPARAKRIYKTFLEFATPPIGAGGADWGLDISTGTPILVYKNCSVIESEQARYVLSLIASDAGGAGVMDARPDSFHSDSGECDRVQGPGPTDAERYQYMIDCDFQAGRKYVPTLDEADYKARLRAKHDAAILAKGSDQGEGK